MADRVRTASPPRGPAALAGGVAMTFALLFLAATYAAAALVQAF